MLLGFSHERTLKKKWEHISAFCGATGFEILMMSHLDFKAVLVALMPTCDGFHKITSGVTPAYFLVGTWLPNHFDSPTFSTIGLTQTWDQVCGRQML